MKTSLISRALLITLVLGSVDLAAGTVQQLKVRERIDPVFPQGLLLKGITRGAVRCVVDVDATGRVEDVLVLAHTDEQFARVVDEALRLWSFEPARLDGQPVPAQTTLEFSIEAVGAVTSLDLVSYVGLQFRTIWGDPYTYQPRQLKELDAIPLPKRSVKPSYPVALAERAVRGRVRVDFYIDERGQVRVPIVTQSDHPELAAAAMTAVRQWQFEPPLRRGRPVLVQASQDFDFEHAP